MMYCFCYTQNYSISFLTSLYVCDGYNWYQHFFLPSVFFNPGEFILVKITVNRMPREVFTKQAVNRMLEEVRMLFWLLAPCHMQSSFSDEELLQLTEYKDAMVQGESAEFSASCLSCLEHFFTTSLYNIGFWLGNYPNKELCKFMKLSYHEYNPPDECD